MTDASLDREPQRDAPRFERRVTPRSVEVFSALTPPASRVGARAIVASGLRLLRDGLADALSRSSAITVIASVSDVDQARGMVSDLEPDVVLVDIGMPESLALVRAIHDAVRSPKIVAFAVSESDDALVRYIEAGIDGYVTRDGSLSDVVATVESVGRGETIISPKLAASLFHRLASKRARDDAPVKSSVDELTSREREILTLVEQGMANKEIARTLGIELATVKNHVHHVLEKLKVTRRGQAAARARAAKGR